MQSYNIRISKVSPDYNLKIKYPEVTSQWHPTLNGNKKPEDFRPRSRKKVWWLCKRNVYNLLVIMG